MKPWIVIHLLLLLLITSCDPRLIRFFPNRPITEFDHGTASPDAVLGFNDGCEVGMAAGSNSFYKMFHRSNQVDGYKMVSSKDYKAGWGVGWWYCYRYDYIKHKSGLYGSFFRGHY
jgi:hypothetical protein